MGDLTEAERLDAMERLDRAGRLPSEFRGEYERLRDLTPAQAAELSESDQLIRQFLRGDAEGPITRRRAMTNYAEDLLGVALPDGPSIEPTRG